jgi:hypothetical protein
MYFKEEKKGNQMLVLFSLSNKVNNQNEAVVCILDPQLDE